MDYRHFTKFRGENWVVYHVGNDATAPEDFHLKLQSNAARADANDVWNDTAPTSSLFTVGANAGVVASGEDFREVIDDNGEWVDEPANIPVRDERSGAFVDKGFIPKNTDGSSVSLEEIVSSFITAVIETFLPSLLLYCADSMFIYNSASKVIVALASLLFLTIATLPTVKPLAVTSTLAA